MKSLNLIIILCLGLYSSIHAQQVPYCKQNTETTNPDITGGFDWRLELLNDGEVYIPTGPQQVNFGSPFFYPQGQPNLNIPAVPLLKDFRPEDGWEVVYYDFGTPSNAVNDPVFVLYNRYKGILRVFMLLINDDAEAKKAIVYLEWAENSNNVKMGNAYLSGYKTPMDAMNKFNSTHSNIQFAKPNQYVVDQHFWLFADFPIIYDPCICEKESFLLFRASLIQESDIEMIINQNPINNSQVVQGGVTNTGSDWFKATFSGIQTGSKQTKVIKDSFTQIKVSEAQQKQTQTAPLKNLINAGILSTANSWLNGISGVMNLLDFFIAGGADEHKETNVAMVPSSKAWGTITTSNDYIKQKVLAPGADGAQNLNPLLVPKYHNPLGIINLMEAPEVEYIEYNMLLSTPTGALLPNGQNIVSRLPKVRQYKLKKDIKFALNPHSNLELKSIEGAFLYRIGGPRDNKTKVLSNDYVSNITINGASNVMHGPIGPANTEPIDFNNYEESLFDQGIEINRWEVDDDDWLDSLTFKTPYSSLSCMKNNQFRVFVNRAYEWNNYPEWDYGGSNDPEITFRIRAVLERKDGKGEPVIFIATYNVETPTKVTLEETPMCNLILQEGGHVDYVQDLIGNSYGDYSYYVNGFTTASDPNWVNMFDNIENILNMTSPNTYPPGDYFGLYEVNMNGNSSQTLNINGISDIVSGKHINVGNNVKLNAGVTLRIDPNEVYPGCWEPSEPVGDEYLGDFCKSFNPYYSKRDVFEFNSEFDKFNMNIKIYPNPAKEVINITFNINDVDAEVWITDLSGKTIKPKDTYFENSIKIPIRSIPSGMYIVHIQIQGQITSKKLIITK
ncbi:T9SS type A sorting domain-containing protein [bacterium SCSIO 12643]|nr:T9SS type A sorting domain-containing protein [bacterium SCSIO 12643]